ncbi:amino acid ABC transporter ATP-binding protein [Acetilactobacillus jinshanensis]|uniref:Amino acid ABC transporter ATP-binding protein n=1 Tax=Acetilactobacillus jinshanensis TaxID=1720083 RepID=A0A4V1ALP2_9LACO|nr:amino acid ABC transporter ATP-binding protein [Acetilactobacillus jinshanensis]QBP18289.1 amino acid ABC transporter ATP-binding protein [Acetilactobacillus jinshanensis]URL61153.1 amino acid ABC transporter ATP-binding protein [uncultured bacterium]
MISFHNVTKTYGTHKALDHVSVSFPDHKTTVIIGPSGAGKSTLLRSLNLLEHPESGIYDFNGKKIDFSKNISAKTTLDIRRRTEMVFQSYNLFPHLTVVKNVMIGQTQVLHIDKATAKKNALKILDRVGLKNKANQYPSALSGGQAQRVAIARSLAMKPEYMLLDEPTSALDPQIGLGILRILAHVAKREQSMIMITHNLNFARKIADKIVFVDDGKILFDGPTAEFFKKGQKRDPRINKFMEAMTLSDL